MAASAGSAARTKSLLGAASAESFDHRAGLPGDDRAGRVVPRAEGALEERVEPAGRHEAQIEGCRALPADVAHLRQQPRHDRALDAPHLGCVRESGADERLGERDRRGDVDRRSVVEPSRRRALADRGRVQLAARRIVDDARHIHPAQRVGLTLDHRDAHRVVRDAVQIVRGAVDRVDDPGQPAGAGVPAALLAEDAVIGTRVGKAVPDEALDFAVGFRDDVDGTRFRVRHLDALAPRLPRAPRLERDGPGEVEQLSDMPSANHECASGASRSRA